MPTMIPAVAVARPIPTMFLEPLTRLRSSREQEFWKAGHTGKRVLQAMKGRLVRMMKTMRRQA